MPFDIAAGTAVPPADLNAAFVSAFSDYLIGPYEPALAEWPAFLQRQGVDLPASRVARGPAGDVLAFAFVAPRPRVGRWRLAGMGAVPAARGSGAAAALLDDFVARAGAAGVPAVELECFARNERALRLYRGRGFEVAQALNGWSRPAGLGDDLAPTGALDGEPPVHPVDRAAAMAWLDDLASRVPDLPLQACADGLRGSPRTLQAWRAGGAQLVFSVPEAGAASVASLADPTSGQRGARSLVRALLAAHAGRGVVVPALQREDLGGLALRDAGFRQAEFNQVMMVRPSAA